MNNATSNLTKLNASAKRKLNDGLHTLTTNRYFDGLPITEICNLIDQVGGDTEEMNGVYCGAEGRSSAQIASNCYLHMSWYKMPVTGRYEVVAYAN